MKVAIFDYGVGNHLSLARLLARAGTQPIILSDPVRALTFDALVFPGVGSFGPAASAVTDHAPAIRAALASGHPCLAIGLGMHLLFESSDDGEGSGMAVLPGKVRRLQARRSPHIGWNDVSASSDPLFRGLNDFLAYFANGAIAELGDDSYALSWTEHERQKFPAAVRRDRTWGVQFRPEKSGAVGAAIVQNFVAAVRG